MVSNDFSQLCLVLASQQQIELLAGQILVFSGGSMLDQLVLTVVGHLASFHGAGVGLLAHMSSLVVILVSTRRELLSTDLAPIRFFSGVHSHVNLLKV